MKMFRLFLILIVMLTTISIGSARAQEPDSEMGYLPLLTTLEADLPLEMQAQNAFEHLMPILLLEKQNGTLLEYKPEFGVGILMLKYTAGKRPSTLAGRPVFDDVHAAMTAVPHPQRANSEVAAGAQVRAFLYDSCFNIMGLVAGNYVKGSLLDDTQQQIAGFESDVTNGNFLACFKSQASFVNIMPGYKMNLQVYSSAGGVLQSTLTSYVPSIRFTGLNKVNKIAQGRGPVAKGYQLCWQYRNSLNTSSSVCKAGTISNTANWSTQFTNNAPVSFRGGDVFLMYVDFNAHFNFQIQMWFPVTRCFLGSNYCYLYGFAGKPASLTATRAGKSYTVTGTFGAQDGWFGGIPNSPTAFPINLIGGDLINGTNVALYTLPNLTTAINYLANTVNGKAPANSNFVVNLHSQNTATWHDALAHSDAVGNYSVNFSSMIDLKSSDTIMISFDYWNHVTGNQTNLEKVFAP